MSFKSPESFTKTLRKGSHTLLLYEDQLRAEQIRLDFVKSGLIQNQHCVYITTSNDGQQFEKSLDDDNIDMEKIRKKGIFQVYNIDNPFTNYGGFSNSIDKIWTEISKTTKSPVRIACNIIGDITKITNSQVTELLEKESCINHDFAKSNDFLLCTYYVGKVNSETNSKFLESIKEHGSVMFLPENSEGIGFSLD